MQYLFTERAHLMCPRMCFGIAAAVDRPYEETAAAEALAGAQGVCPQGWHIPTIEDIIGLVGKAVSPIATNSQAPYYDGNNGSTVQSQRHGRLV